MDKLKGWRIYGTYLNKSGATRQTRAYCVMCECRDLAIQAFRDQFAHPIIEVRVLGYKYELASDIIIANYPEPKREPMIMLEDMGNMLWYHEIMKQGMEQAMRIKQKGWRFTTTKKETGSFARGFTVYGCTKAIALRFLKEMLSPQFVAEHSFSFGQWTTARSTDDTVQLVGEYHGRG